MNRNKKTLQSAPEKARRFPEAPADFIMPQPVDLDEENPVDEAEEYLRRAKERERQRREADMAQMQSQLASQQARARKSHVNLQNKNFTYDYNGNPIIVNNNRNNNLPALSYQVKHSIQDSEVISPKPRQAPQMREITNVKKPFKPNFDSEQEITQKHVIQAGVPTYDLLEPQAGVTYIENGKTKNSTIERYGSTLAKAGSLISTTFGTNTRLSRNEYLQLTKSNSSLVGMSIRGRDFGTQIMEKPTLQAQVTQITPITPPNISQNRNLPALVSPGDKGILSNKPVLSSLNHNSASTPFLDSTGVKDILPHSSKNISTFALDNAPSMRPNTEKTQKQVLKENANNIIDGTQNGTMSYAGSMKKGLVYFDSEKVKSLLALDEDMMTSPTGVNQNQNQNQPKQETYQATYNMNTLNTNNNITSKISPVDLHNTNIIGAKDWGKVTFSMTGNSALPILPSRKPQIGGSQNTLGGKNMRHRVSAAGAGNSYVELLHSTIRNQQIV